METSMQGAGDKQIRDQIEAIRNRMLVLGDTYGLSDPLVLSASRELDALIVYYHSINKMENPQQA